MRSLTIIVLLLLAACQHGSAPKGEPPPITAAAPLEAPFDVVFVRKASFAPGHDGFDAALPGWHLTGDIARIRLVPRAPSNANARRPEMLVLRLHTSPGNPPNVENLTISAGGLELQTALSNGTDGKGTIEVRKLADPPNSPRRTVPQGDYLDLKLQNGAVYVGLKKAAMELLKDGGDISWIDWYRG